MSDNEKTTPTMRVISLGAGVQSTTLLLMALHGEFDHRPDCAIFADTGWEQQKVYEHLEWLESVARKYNFPIYRTQHGNLRDDILAVIDGKRKRVANPPFFVRNQNGKKGVLMRHCTRDYKINAVVKKTRELFGLKPRQRVPKGVIVEQWMGISMDEIIRMKPSRYPWIINRYPLIEKGMSRDDCLRWMKERGYPLPPKSACIGCPYHSDEFWRELKTNCPHEWADLVEFDKKLRNGLPRVKGEVYLHKSLKPLDEVKFSVQNEETLEDLFGNECEGMCGL